MRVSQIFAECDLQGNQECCKPGVQVLYFEFRIREQKDDLSRPHFCNGILHSFFMPFAVRYDYRHPRKRYFQPGCCKLKRRDTGNYLTGKIS